MINHVCNFEWIVLRSEVEALLTEANLIKVNSPRYNILMKDDKTFPYIRITNEPYPQVLLTRKVIKDGSKYLPFLKNSKYFSSFFVTRAINLNKEKTDERINEIKVHKNKVITIFSGKWNTCVDISHQIKKIILNEK